MSEDDPMDLMFDYVLAEEELVARLWRLAPVDSELCVRPMWTWVMAPGISRSGMIPLLPNWGLSGHLDKLRTEDPEGFVRELGRLAYGDERAFAPERPA